VQLPRHKKLGIIKFMFSLSDNFYIVHVLDSNFVFVGQSYRFEAVYNRVGIKRGYGRTDTRKDTRTDGPTDKRDKMRMRREGIKCGCGQKG
jgi:hypothetical protein